MNSEEKKKFTELQRINRELLNIIKESENQLVDSCNEDYLSKPSDELLYKLSSDLDGKTGLTLKILDMGSTSLKTKSYNNKQLKIFKLKWPLSKGWRINLIGVEFINSDILRFFELRKHKNIKK